MSTKRKGQQKIGVSRTNAAIGDHVAHGIRELVSEGSPELKKARAGMVGRRAAEMIRRSLAEKKK
jgi:hypothetical protein